MISTPRLPGSPAATRPHPIARPSKGRSRRTRRRSRERSATCWRSEETSVAIEIVMPRLGWNMEVGTVVEWLKHDGDRVNAGEFVFLVEGDKSVSEVEALDSGILRIPDNNLRLGEELPVGTPLAYLVQEGEQVGSPPASLAAAGEHAPTPEVAAVSAETASA